MKYVYKIYYEQKFGKLWRDYTANVIGGEDAIPVIEKVKRKAMNEEFLADESEKAIDCGGFRLISVERSDVGIDY